MASLFSESFGKLSSLSYHESNVSLIARETKRLLVNHQLIPIAIRPKNISLEQICYKRSQGIALTSPPCLHHLGPQSLFFPSNVLKLTV